MKKKKKLPLYAKYVIFYEDETKSIGSTEFATTEIKIELPHECTVNDCITEALIMLNDKFESSNQN